MKNIEIEKSLDLEIGIKSTIKIYNVIGLTNNIAYNINNFLIRNNQN